MNDTRASTLVEMDVLIITAVKDEFDAVLAVRAGEVDSGPWRPSPGGGDVVLLEKDFRAVDGGVLRFGVIQAYDMGQSAATYIAMKVLPRGTRCLSMCGVCAGRREKVSLGDVIFADRVWTYDTGKIVREPDESGIEVERIDGDVKTWNLWGPWKQAAERYSVGADDWLLSRPLSLEHQGWWVLSQLASGVDPAAHAQRRERCPNWLDVVLYLRKRGLVSNTGLELTSAGRAALAEDAILHPDGHPEPLPFAIHVSPVASGNAVREDRSIFPRLSRSMRKVLGLEMEASAIGFLAEMEKLDHFIVAKGVMDFGDNEKADHFKSFAARASAECLIGFLRSHLPSLEPARTPTLSATQSEVPPAPAPSGKSAIRTPEPTQVPPRATRAILMWTRTLGSGAASTHIIMEDGTAGTVVVPGLLLATAKSLWELAGSSRPVRIFPAELLDELYTSGFKLEEETQATRIVLLGDSGLVDRVSGARMPLASFDPPALATEPLFEHERFISISGTIGPYVLSVQSDWRYGGGPHPDTECRFSVLDLERAMTVADWLTHEERATIDLREAAVARKAFEVMREDDRLMDVGNGEGVTLVAAKPAIDEEEGTLLLRYQFALFTSYVQTDRHWGSYFISEFVNSRALPARFEPYRSTPKLVVDAARSLPHGTVLGGWSPIDSTHPGWALVARRAGVPIAAD